MIIPYLTSEIILGNNWLHDQRAIIDYNDGKIQLSHGTLSAGIVSFGRTLSGENVTHSGGVSSDVQTLRLVLTQDLLNSNDSYISECKNFELPNQVHEDQQSRLTCERLNQSFFNEVHRSDEPINQVCSNHDNENSPEFSKQDLNQLNLNVLFEESNKEDIALKNFEIVRVRGINVNCYDYCEICFDNKAVNNGVCENCLIYSIGNLNEDDHNINDLTGLSEVDFWQETNRAIARKLTSLSPVQSSCLLQLISRYKLLFSDKPGCTDIYHHKIKLKNMKAYCKKSYQFHLLLEMP